MCRIQTIGSKPTKATNEGYIDMMADR